MSNKVWEYHTPDFESDKLNPEMMKYSPWSGHRQFVYDYVVDTEPESIVELGSYYGCSAFTFLQAIKDHSLSTNFYAIDTWAGDSFTESDYKEDIYGSYKVIQDTFFEKQNKSMLRMTFDEANCLFQDDSIDILHIDGAHTYEHCRHDFETWKSKVKKNGVVLFHDISEDRLNGELLGSHLYWEELKETYQYTCEFPYSFGLGLLFFEKEAYERVTKRIDFAHYQKCENQAAVIFKDVIRKRYFELREANKYIDSLKEQVEICQDHLRKYEKTQQEKDAYIQELESKNEWLINNDRLREDFEHTVNKYKTTIEGKDQYILQLEEQIKNYPETIRCLVTDYQNTISGKEAYILELRETVDSLNGLIYKKEKYESELLDTIKKYDETVKGKDNYIHELEEHIEQVVSKAEFDQKEIINKYNETVKGKDNYIQELEDGFKQIVAERDSKQNCILELERRVETYSRQLDNLRYKIKKLPMGEYVLKRMEMESGE